MGGAGVWGSVKGSVGRSRDQNKQQNTYLGDLAGYTPGPLWDALSAYLSSAAQGWNERNYLMGGEGYGNPLFYAPNDYKGDTDVWYNGYNNIEIPTPWYGAATGAGNAWQQTGEGGNWGNGASGGTTGGGSNSTAKVSPDFAALMASADANDPGAGNGGGYTGGGAGTGGGTGTGGGNGGGYMAYPNGGGARSVYNPPTGGLIGLLQGMASGGPAERENDVWNSLTNFTSGAMSPYEQKNRDYSQGLIANPKTIDDTDVERVNRWLASGERTGTENDTFAGYKNLYNNPMNDALQGALAGYTDLSKGQYNDKENEYEGMIKQFMANPNWSGAAGGAGGYGGGGYSYTGGGAHAQQAAAPQDEAYLREKFKGLVEKGGYTPEQATAILTDQNLASRATYDRARDEAGRALLRRGSGAGYYGGIAQMGADEAKQAADAARAAQIQIAEAARTDRNAGLAGLGTTMNSEQQRNLTNAQLGTQASIANAGNASSRYNANLQADIAAANRALQAQQFGLSSLLGLDTQARQLQTTGLSGMTGIGNQSTENQFNALGGMKSMDETARGLQMQGAKNLMDQNNEYQRRRELGLSSGMAQDAANRDYQKFGITGQNQWNQQDLQRRMSGIEGLANLMNSSSGLFSGGLQGAIDIGKLPREIYASGAGTTGGVSL